jgi:hypothetical protein
MRELLGLFGISRQIVLKRSVCELEETSCKSLCHP